MNATRSKTRRKTRASGLIENSEPIATYSTNGEPQGSLHWHHIDIYRHAGGKYFSLETGGPAMRKDRNPRWLTRDEVIAEIATHVADPVTGYRYSREQANIIVDGGDPGRGYED